MIFSFFQKKSIYNAVEYAIAAFQLIENMEAHLNAFLDDIFEFSAQEEGSFLSYLNYWEQKERIKNCHTGGYRCSQNLNHSQGQGIGVFSGGSSFCLRGIGLFPEVEKYGIPSKIILTLLLVGDESTFQTN